MREVAAFDTADGLYDCCWCEDNEHVLVSASGDGSVKASYSSRSGTDAFVFHLSLLSPSLSPGVGLVSTATREPAAQFGRAPSRGVLRHLELRASRRLPVSFLG
jgi:hypothetical protein